MNAIQPSRPPLQPIQKRRVTPGRARRQRLRSYQVMALETTAKIGVNLLISAAAVSALVKLLPEHWSQQDKLRAIRTEVKLMDVRVNSLQADFIPNFDQRQTQRIMQEKAYRFDPNQRQIVFPKDATEVEKP